MWAVSQKRIMIRQTWILDSALWIPDFLSVELGFQTPIEGRIWDSFSCITGSNPRISGRALYQHFFQHFSEVKALTIIRAFQWSFSRKLGFFFSQRIKIEAFLKRYDDFKNNIQNTIFKFYLHTAMKTIFFAILKLFICIHCCHTTLLALK